jgi:RNA recognition motif-containing protein
MNIYVGNLHFKLVEEELREIFEEYGEVDSVKIITDRETGRSKGFGFVEMSDDTKASQAIEDLNGAELMGRDIRVNTAREKTDRRPRRETNTY